MRLVLNENTLNEINKIKEYIRENQSVLLIDKCLDGKLLHRVMIHGDYNPFSPEELKRKLKAPKFEIRSIRYTDNDFSVDAETFLTFDEAYTYFTELVGKMN